MTFWIIIIALAAIVAATVSRVLLRERSRTEESHPDISIYRDQLREVERDVKRGVLTEAEAQAVRTEVSRRLLEADRLAQGTSGSKSVPRWATYAGLAFAGISLVAGSLAIYGWIGAPGYPDLPLDRRIALAEEARLNRPAQAEAEATIPPLPPSGDVTPEFTELMKRLRVAVEQRPDDLQGHILLARNEARLGNFPEAHKAQKRVIEIMGDKASAADYADLADLLVIAAGGYVSPEAEAAVSAALARDARNGTARYYSGLLAAQTGRPDIAFRIWRSLLETTPDTAPWSAPIRSQIGNLAQLAGVDYVVPAVGEQRGPSAADIEAAGEMSPEDRMSMIENMVDGLAARLAEEGGPPGDWARLIRALGVLGRTEAAAGIWAEAQAVFPDEATRIPILQAARDAGVAQ